MESLWVPQTVETYTWRNFDANDPLPFRFYAFGNMDKVVKIWDAHIIPRDLTDADCKGSTYKDPPTNLCFLKYHEYYDPFAGWSTIVISELLLISISVRCEQSVPQEDSLFNRDMELYFMETC